MKGFRVEQGDVLLSIQMVLTREEEMRRRLLAGAGAPRPAQSRAVTHQIAAPAPRPVVTPPPTARHAPIRSLQPASSTIPAPSPVRNGKRPTGPPSMVDTLTGVGTLHALRRDLILQQAWPLAGQGVPALVALEVSALDQIRADMGAEAGDRVLKSLVEVAPFALRTQDRIYRSGRNQLTLLLPETDGAGAESARSALETALHRRLAGHGYPEVRLAARKLDPVALAS